MTTFFSGQKLRADDLERLLGRESPLPLGVVGYAHRATAGGSNGAGAETAALRLDDIPIYAGRFYKISTSSLDLDTTVADDEINARLRITTDGSTPGTGSTQIGGARITADDATFTPQLPIVAYRAPAVDELLSVVLTAQRVNGTGTVQLFASATQPMEITIEDMGLSPGDTGVDL